MAMRPYDLLCRSALGGRTAVLALSVFILVLAAAWGYLETYRIVDPVAAFWWPTIWCFGLGIGAIFNKVKYGTFGEVR